MRILAVIAIIAALFALWIPGNIVKASSFRRIASARPLLRLVAVVSRQCPNRYADRRTILATETPAEQIQGRGSRLWIVAG